MKKAIFLAGIGCLLTLYTNGQERVGAFMLYDQLPELRGKRIHRVYQGQEGYLWIASSDGLVRFDGRRYTTYFQSANGPTDNQIADVLEDKSGNLWVAGRRNGIARKNRQNNGWRSWPVLWPAALGGQRIQKLFLDKQDQLWAITNGGLGRYEANTDSFTLHQPISGKPDENALVSMVQIDSISFWIISTRAIYRYQKQKNQFFEVFPGSNKTAITAFTAACDDGNGGLWLVTWGQGFYRLAAGTDKLTPLPMVLENGKNVSGYVSTSVETMPDHSLLMATGLGGLLRYKPGGQYLEQWYPEKTPDLQLGLMDIHSISCTPDAGIWIGATGSLLQWHPSFQRLGKRLDIPFRPEEKELLLGELAWDANTQTHLLACAGRAGLLLANADFTKISPVKDRHLPDKAFADVARSTDGRWLALAHYSGRLYLVDAKNATMEPHQLLGSPLLPKMMENDSMGRLWVAGNTEVVCYRKGQPPMYFGIKASTKNPFPKSYELRTDGKGRAWISTNHGLYRFDADNYETVRVPVLRENGTGMANLLVRSFSMDAKNGVWIGYDGDGLELLDGDSLVVVKSWKAEELPSSSINSLAFGSMRQLLAGTNRGLGALRKISQGWEIYGVGDGLEQDFLDRTVAASPAGKILVNLRDGFQVFDEMMLNQTRQPMQIQITQILVNNLPVETIKIDRNHHTISLPYHQNNLEISFAAMHWLHPGGTSYFYRFMKGKEEPNWQGMGEPLLALAALRPGNYRLQLLARGAGGSTSNVHDFFIEIKSPFWWQWWFIMLCLLAAAGITYALYIFRLRHLMAMQHVRNAISQNLHDDIGASLSNIQILNELARQQLDKQSKAYEMLSKAGSDVQGVSEALSDIVWNVSPRYDELKNLFIRMKRYAGDTLDAAGIKHQLDLPDYNIPQRMSMEKRRDFYLVYKEAINNIVKHARCTEASVKILLKQNDIELVISDNGCGFNVQQAAAGNGLANMKQRLFKWRGTLSIESEPGKGTKLFCVMPL